MMSWLNSHVRFEDHRAILYISRRSRSGGDRINALLMDAAEPHVIEPLVRLLIMEARPELSGCCIWALNFNYDLYAWEIGISHPSLPAVPDGCMSKRIPLYPEPAEAAA